MENDRLRQGTCELFTRQHRWSDRVLRCRRKSNVHRPFRARKEMEIREKSAHPRPQRLDRDILSSRDHPSTLSRRSTLKTRNRSPGYGSFPQRPRTSRRFPRANTPTSPGFLDRRSTKPTDRKGRRQPNVALHLWYRNRRYPKRLRGQWYTADASRIDRFTRRKPDRTGLVTQATPSFDADLPSLRPILKTPSPSPCSRRGCSTPLEVSAPTTRSRIDSR